MSEWWDEDPELLGATLGLLAAWDGEAAMAAPNSPSTPPSPSSPDSSGHATIDATTSESGRRRRSVNVSRERRKQELHFLRTKVDAMQRQLHELRARRDAQLRPHFSDTQQTQLATVAPVWENMATRQICARKRSEIRNAKLKTMLGAQLRVAEDLIRVIRHAEQRTRRAAPSVPSMLRLPIDVSQRMSEEDQLQRLDMLCANWASEFTRCDKFAPSSLALQFLDMRVVEDSREATVIELFSSSVLPYPVARVEETMWNLYLEDGGLDDEGETFTQTATATDDLIIAVFSVTTTLDNGLRGTMHGKNVTKRLYPSATQTVLVSHTQSEPQGYANELDGVETFEDSWVRLVDASELGHIILGGPLTVVQHVRRERIVVREGKAQDVDNGDAAAASRSRIEMVTRIVMNQIREEIDWAQQTIEDLLMDGANDGRRVRGEPH